MINRLLKSMNETRMLLQGAVFGIFVYAILILAADNALAQYWVDNPANCPVTYSGQNCTPNKVCGVNGSTAQCYDTDSLTPPGGSVTSNTDQTGSYGGGYILNCYALDSVANPYCDNNGAWWCDRSETCYTTLHRDTTCVGGLMASSTCANCRSGYISCNGAYDSGDGCEVQSGVTDCSAGANNNINSSCICVCDSNRYDCDASGAGVGNGCEVVNGAACTLAGLPGTWNGPTCSCVISKSNFQTGTEAKYSSGDPFLWGTEYGTGSLMQFISDQASTSGGIFTIKNGGSVGIGTLNTSGLLTVGATTSQQMIVDINGNIIDGNWQGDTISASYGGTGWNSSSATGLAFITGGSWAATNSLSVAYGGTGSTSLTGILKGNGTGSLITALPGSDYELPLTFNNPLTRAVNAISLNYASPLSLDGSNQLYIASGAIAESLLDITSGPSTGHVMQYDGTKMNWVSTTTIGIPAYASSGTAGQVAFYAGNGNTVSGTSTVSITASQFVGINTTSPAYTLDVNGNFRVTSGLRVGAYSFPVTDGTTGFVLKTDGSGALTWQPDITTSGAAGVWATSTDSLAIYPTTISNVVVIGAGGTSTTGYIFEVNGSSLFDNITTSDITANGLTLTNALGVQYGGTGSTSLTGMLKGSGTNLTSVTGTTGYATYWSDNNTISATGTMSQNIGGTGFSSYTAGDMIYSNSGGNLTKLPIGTNGYILGVVSGNPGWVSTSSLGVASSTHEHTGVYQPA